MHTIIELYEQILPIEQKLKELVGFDIKFDSVGSLFAERHAMDLRSNRLPLHEKEQIDTFHLALLKLKQLNAINFEIKTTSDYIQFIVHEIDFEKLKSLTCADLNKTQVGIPQYSSDEVRNTIYNNQLGKTECCYFVDRISNNKKPEQIQLNLEKALNLEEALAEKNYEFIKENNPTLKRFCLLFNITPEEIEKNVNFKKCYAYFESGILNIKQVTLNENNASVNIKDVNNENDIINQHNKITRLTIYGVSYLKHPITETLKLNNDLAEKFINEAQQRFQLLASSPYYTRSKTISDIEADLKAQYNESKTKQPIVSIRGSNSQFGHIVITIFNGKESEPFLVKINFLENRIAVLAPGWNALTDKPKSNWKATYKNVDEFIQDFLKKNKFLRDEVTMQAPTNNAYMQANTPFLFKAFVPPKEEENKLPFFGSSPSSPK